MSDKIVVVVNEMEKTGNTIDVEEDDYRSELRRIPIIFEIRSTFFPKFSGIEEQLMHYQNPGKILQVDLSIKNLCLNELSASFNIEAKNLSDFYVADLFDYDFLPALLGKSLLSTTKKHSFVTILRMLDLLGNKKSIVIFPLIDMPQMPGNFNLNSYEFKVGCKYKKDVMYYCISKFGDEYYYFKFKNADVYFYHTSACQNFEIGMNHVKYVACYVLYLDLLQIPPENVKTVKVHFYYGETKSFAEKSVDYESGDYVVYSILKDNDLFPNCSPGCVRIYNLQKLLKTDPNQLEYLKAGSLIFNVSLPFNRNDESYMRRLRELVFGITSGNGDYCEDFESKITFSQNSPTDWIIDMFSGS